MTDVVTDDIAWIQGTRMSSFNTRFGPKNEKALILYMYNISFL